MSANVLERLGRFRREGLGTLPGHEHFVEVSGYQRPAMADVVAQNPPPRASAVMALIHMLDDEPQLLFMRRPEYDGIHSGQIAFPGGRQEPEDTSLEQTARREFTEETGADTSGIEIIGAISPVYIPPSRSLVTPFLAYTEKLGPLRPDPHEVAELFHAPLAHVLRDDIMERRTLFIAAMGREAEVPYFDVMGHVVWGATAMMVAELRVLFGVEP